jgi:hypothetical protein
VPIVTTELPPDALDAVRHALTSTQRFPRRRGGQLSLSSPHPIFAIPLNRFAAAAGRPLEAAALVGWRALLEEDKRVVAAVELPVTEGAKASALVNRGPFVASTVAGITVAEAHERVATQSFELRLLRVNALYLHVVWLHTTEIASDLFIPLEPAPAPLKAQTVYERAGFEAELMDVARSVASSYQAAERPDELGS